MTNQSSRTNGRRPNVAHDRTNYGILLTPPSPTQMSPVSQSGSNSASSSSSSPPEPTTPLRVSRSRTRYPELGRVPLHRRGTSKTYECMEDLLKEAGYKETRIFTPETDRKKADRGSTDDNRLSAVKDGMEAVVGFFAGLLPSASSGKSFPESYTTSPQESSPPFSPLTQRYSSSRPSLDLTEPPTPSTNLTSSIESLKDPTPRTSRQHISQINSPAPTIIQTNTHPQYNRQQPPSLVGTPSQLSYASQQLRNQPSRNSINRQNDHVPPPPSPNLIVSPRPSRAGAYLRHMSSAPSMPPRPNSTPAHLFNRPKILLNDNDSEGPPSTFTRRGNGEGESEEPPLPPTWLETVARAVLFGGTGAYVGGPAHFQQEAHGLAPPPSAINPKMGKGQVLRTTRSSLSQVSSQRSKYHHRTARSGLSDQTNTAGFLISPPPLLSKIERGRAGRSEGEVYKTRVVCRSAPGSRSGSVDGKERRNYERGRGNKRKKGDQDRLPSLARTQAEGDVCWSRTTTSTKRRIARSGAGVSNANRYLGGWGADNESDENDGGGYGGASSEEEDDEGELDLARILVPPKRQKSIKSLRKHLVSTDSTTPGGSRAQATLKNIAGVIIPGARASTVAGGKPAATSQRQHVVDDWGGQDNHQEQWGAGWVRKARASDDDLVGSFNGFFGEGRTELVGTGRSGTKKNRLGFNSAWGLTGGAAS